MNISAFYHTDLPPSIIMFWPVIYFESSEHKNCTAALYSLFSAILPIGISFSNLSTNSGGWSIKTPPGDKAFTLTLPSNQYVDKYFVKPIKADLITEYVTGFTAWLFLSVISLFLYNLWSGDITDKSDAIFKITPPWFLAK